MVSRAKELAKMAENTAESEIDFLQNENRELKEKIMLLKSKRSFPEVVLDQDLIANEERIYFDEEPETLAVVCPWSIAKVTTARPSTSKLTLNFTSRITFVGTQVCKACAAGHPTSGMSSTGPSTSTGSSTGPSTSTNPWTSTALPSSSGTSTGPLTSRSSVRPNVDNSTTHRPSRWERGRQLYVATRAGDVSKVQQLLNEKADTEYKDGPSCDTALHVAAFQGDAQIVALLIADGARLNVKKADGNTPLHMAAAAGAVSCMEKLIDAGAIVNVRNLKRNTPLHLAALSGVESGIRMLLRNGANPSIRNMGYKLPKDLAPTEAIRKIL